MKKKILIIDDYSPLLNEVNELLSLEGYKVYTAANGAEGVQKAIQHIPDLILCDVEMPVMNGYDVYRTLEKIPDTSAIPLVLLTAKATTEDFRYGLSLGVDDYLTKPFKIEDLLSTIKKRILKHEKSRNIADNKFLSFSDNPLIGIYIFLDDRFIFINKKFEEITLYNIDDINKVELNSIIIDDNNKITNSFIECYNGKNQNLYKQIQIFAKNGEVLLLDIFAKHIEINGKKAIIGGLLESLSTNKGTDNNNKVKEILKYLTDEDKVIVEQALNISDKSKEYEENQIIKKIGLTKREIEVVGHICQGLTNSQIAEKLFLSKRTVDRHRANILDKTNTNNTAKLVAFVIKHNLI